MEPFADMNCALKVNVHCETCKMKMNEVLSSIIGVYAVDIDAREGLVKVAGEVDPNILLRALARTGKHAEVVWTRLKHPSLSKNSYRSNYGYGGYGYNSYGSSDDPHMYARSALPHHFSRFDDAHMDYPIRRSVHHGGSSYPQNYLHHGSSSTYCNGYVPSYGSSWQHSYVDDPNYCSMM